MVSTVGNGEKLFFNQFLLTSIGGIATRLFHRYKRGHSLEGCRARESAVVRTMW